MSEIVVPDAVLNPPDAGFRDATAGLDGGVDAAGCFPAPGGTFMTTNYTTVGPYLNQCTAKQLDELIAACFSTSGGMSGCDAWVSDAANMSCLDCWAGPVTQNPWHPFLYADNGGQAVFINVAGCIELADKGEATCAQQIEYAFECSLDVCLPTCPIPMNNDTTTLSKCGDMAATTVCSSYATAAGACQARLSKAGSPVAFCFDAYKNPQDLKRYFSLACGAPPVTVDAGPPSDAGAPYDDAYGD